MGEDKKAIDKTPFYALAALFLALTAALPLAQGWSVIVRFDGLQGVYKIGAPFAAVVFFLAFILLSGAAGGFLTAAFEARPAAILPHFLPILTYGAAFGLLYLFCGRLLPGEALPSIIFYLFGFILSRAKIKKAGKTISVMSGAAPALVLIMIVLIVRALMTVGASASFFTDYIGTVRDKLAASAGALATFMKEGFESDPAAAELLSQFGQLPQGLTADAIYEYYADGYTETYVYAAALAPAVIAAACMISAYIAASLSVPLAGRRPGQKKWRLSASIVSVVLFVLACLINAFILPFFGGGAFSVVTVSVMILLIPLMFAMGVTALTKINRKFLSAHKVISIISLILLILNPIVMIAALGAYYVSAKSAAAKLKELQNDGMMPDDPGLSGRQNPVGGPFRLDDEEDEADGEDKNGGGDDNG